jgi:hypothetical protein
LHQLIEDRIGIAVLEAGKQQQVIIFRRQSAPQFLEHVGIEQVFEIGHHHCDDARARGDERAGDGIGSVAQGFRRFEHLGAGFRGNGRARGKAARNSGLGHTGEACHLR